MANPYIPNISGQLNSIGNAGIWSGLANGLQQGLMSYRDVKKDQRDEDQKKRVYNLDLAKAGYEEDNDENGLLKGFKPSSAWEAQQKAKTDLAQRHDQAKQRYEENVYGAKKGATPQRDPDGNLTGYTPNPGGVDLDAVGAARRQADHEKFIHTENDLNRKAMEGRLKSKADASEGGGLKQSQAAAGGYASRIGESLDAMEALKKSGYNRAGSSESFDAKLGSTPLIGGLLSNPQTKQQDQAERNFVNATLRRESGAAISQSEFDNAEKQYLPRVGDDEKTLAQKAQNRRSILASMRAEAGDKTMGAIAKQKGLLGGDTGAPKTQAPPVPKVGDVIEGHQFLGGNPADPSSWKAL